MDLKIFIADLEKLCKYEIIINELKEISERRKLINNQPINSVSEIISIV